MSISILSDTDISLIIYHDSLRSTIKFFRIDKRGLCFFFFYDYGVSFTSEK